MTNNLTKNQPNSKPIKKSIWLLLIIVLIIIITTSIFVFWQKNQNQPKTSRVNQSVISQSTGQSQIKNQPNNSESFIEQPQNQLFEKNRYYNNKGNFSFITPDGWSSEDLIFNISLVDEAKDIGGPCGDFTTTISKEVFNDFQSKDVKSNFTQEMKKSLIGTYQAEIRKNDQGVKYTIGIDICNGFIKDKEGIANTLKFWSFLYNNQTEIIFNYTVPQTILLNNNIKISNLETVAQKLWEHQDGGEIQGLFEKFEKIMESVKFEN